MTEQEILIEVAKIDGLSPQEGQHYNFENPYSPTGISIDYDGNNKCRAWIEKRYTTSHDAILPVINKCWSDDISFDGNKFAKLLSEEVSKLECCFTCTVMRTLKATPFQLATALLKAKGVWREA